MDEIELAYSLLLSDPEVPRAGGNRFPVPLTNRLDHFVAEANALGVRTNRNELLAAIVAGLDPLPAVLKEWVEDLRTTTVGEVDPGRDPASDYGVFVIRGAGRIPGS